jgi:hypothetical protein
LSVPDEGYSRNSSSALNLISTFFYYWVDTFAGGLLVPEGIIRQVVSASALTSIQVRSSFLIQVSCMVYTIKKLEFKKLGWRLGCKTCIVYTGLNTSKHNWTRMKHESVSWCFFLNCSVGVFDIVEIKVKCQL